MLLLGIKLNQFLDIDGHPIKLIHKKEHREVYDDGKYIVKKTKPNAFNFETYKRFQLDNPWCVKVHSFEDGIIVMDKVEGITWQQYRTQVTKDQLWNICVVHRNTVVKSFFDFIGKTYVDANQPVFYHRDATYGNLIMQGDKPMFIDPDGTVTMPWDMFLQRCGEQTQQWFNEYLYWAHRNDK